MIDKYFGICNRKNLDMVKIQNNISQNASLLFYPGLEDQTKTSQLYRFFLMSKYLSPIVVLQRKWPFLKHANKDVASSDLVTEIPINLPKILIR